MKRRATLALVVGVGMLGLPDGVAAHALARSFESRLPLAVYVIGAAAAVALSFAFVLLRNQQATAPIADGRGRSVPGWLQRVLRVVGLVAWAWIMVQGVLGGESDAEVSRLFTWVYGWVGIALISAFVGPIWTWLDPFTTLHDLGARLLRAAGVEGMAPAAIGERAGRWPAVAGFAAVVWLELVASGAASRTLALVIGGYTVYTLAMMAQYGRRPWSERGEIFSVWFALLGRLAPFALVDDGTGTRVRRRVFGAGLREESWARSDVVLVALGTGSILFDGLSQTEIWVDAFGLPAALPQTLLLGAFLGLIVGAALVVARLVGVAGTGAGLLPISVGYLLAHYFTYLLTDGQRIVIAVSDPFQRGSNYFGTSFFEPSSAWIPPAFVWALQLGAVVGGHMIGAWAGHAVSAGSGTQPAREVRMRQVPLAVMMVALTTLTLWSLGQALFVPVS